MSVLNGEAEFMSVKTTTNKDNQGQNQRKVSRDEVAQRAYQLWVAAGQPFGRDLEYWLQAEAELLPEYIEHLPNTRVDDDLQCNRVINVINTDRIPPSGAAQLIADGKRRYFQGANVKQLSISQTR